MSNSAGARRELVAAADDFADRLLDARGRLLMHAATAVNDPIDRRGADTRAGGDIGDFWSAFEHRTSLPVHF